MRYTRLYLCRHGEVVGDGKRRYNGHRDVDITRKGVMQMESLRDRLREAPLAAVYSSDLIRTVRGADIISDGHPATKIRKQEFRERAVGAWEGMAFEEIESAYPREWKAWLNDIVNFTPPGGESFGDLRRRILPALYDMVGEYDGREIALVAHGGVNRVILAEAMGLELRNAFRIEQNYGSLNIIDFYEDGMPVVKLLNG